MTTLEGLESGMIFMPLMRGRDGVIDGDNECGPFNSPPCMALYAKRQGIASFPPKLVVA